MAPVSAQQGGSPVRRGVSPPIEVNPGFKGRLAVFNFSSKPVSGRMLFLDAVTGDPIPESVKDISVLAPRKGVYHDVVFPTGSMLPGMPDGSGLPAWEIVGIFLFRGDTSDVVGSVEVRQPTGEGVAHIKVEIEGVTEGA